jgi:hypothetical protein|tara:strand:- start:739 stop:1101 length:363 start_codon:yes stop_codon:yes gene_type:complete
MLSTILSSVGSLASSYIEGKTAIQKAEATIRMKEATGEIDWDLAAMRASQSSWKDEWLTLLFSIPLILSFCGSWGREIVADGFTALAGMPQWYQIALGAIVSASFATRASAKFFGTRKKK